MAAIKEKDLPTAAGINSTDYIRVVDSSGTSKKAPGSLLTSIQQEITDLDNSISSDSINKWVKIGNFAMCWGTKTPSSINSQNAIIFPFTFASPPTGFAGFNGNAKGSTYAQIKVKDVTTTGMTVYFYESGGAVADFSWLAIGFI